MIKLFDETAFSLRLDLAREKKLREEVAQRCCTTLYDASLSSIDCSILPPALPMSVIIGCVRY